MYSAYKFNRLQVIILFVVFISLIIFLLYSIYQVQTRNIAVIVFIVTGLGVGIGFKYFRRAGYVYSDLCYMEEVIKQNERQLTSIISHLPGFVYRCLNNPTWSMKYISEGCKPITGYDPDDFLSGRVSFNEIIAPAYKQDIHDQWQAAIKGRVMFEMEYPIIRVDGEQRWLWERGKGEFDNEGSLIFLEGYIEDISDRKNAERELRESEERYRLIMNSSQDAIVLTTPEGRVISANLAACMMFGMTVREMAITDPNRLVDMPEEQLKRILSKRVLNKHVKGELTFIRKDGSRFPAEVTSSLFENSKGDILSSMIIRDITQRKRDEQIQKLLNDQLLAAKLKAEGSDRLKTSFLANMSHEIRTPMNGILGFMELLKEPDLEADIRKEYIELVNESGNRLLNTINDIIEISKIEAGEVEVKKQVLNINETFRFCFEFFKPQAAEKKLDFRIGKTLSNEQSSLISDKHKIDSILSNLIKNAIKFTKNGYIEIGNYLHDDSIILYVKDSGVGIPKHRLQAIFDRFVQAELKIGREFEGSGLGLSIVKSYVESLEGSVWVESEPGAGSIFRVKIPYTPVNVITGSQTVDCH